MVPQRTPRAVLALFFLLLLSTALQCGPVDAAVLFEASSCVSALQDACVVPGCAWVTPQPLALPPDPTAYPDGGPLSARRPPLPTPDDPPLPPAPGTLFPTAMLECLLPMSEAFLPESCSLPAACSQQVALALHSAMAVTPPAVVARLVDLVNVSAVQLIPGNGWTAPLFGAVLAALPTVADVDASHVTLTALRQSDFPVAVASSPATPALRRLSLAHCGLNDIGDAVLSRFTALVALSLANNNIKMLTADTLSGLSSLAYLSLADNAMRNFSHNGLAPVPALVTLDLGSNLLDTVSIPAGQGTALRALGLNRNTLTALHADAFGVCCSNLRTLDLCDNSLTVLPASLLVGTTHLTHLLLVGNPLEQLPPGLLAHCPDLEQLAVDGTRITTLTSDSLPPVAAGGPSVLTAAGAKLSRLGADVLAHRSRLTTLVLADNALSRLELGTLDGCTALVKLDLAGNGLTALPSLLLAHATRLETLLVGDNGLTTLPVALLPAAGLPTLRELDLTRNRLTHLPPALLSTVTGLQILKLAHNALQHLPQPVSPDTCGVAHPALRTLQLSGNQLRTLDATALACAGNMTLLELDGNELTVLPDGLFATAEHLVDLNLGNNQLTVLAASIFAPLVRLTSLRLSGNWLETLPTGLFTSNVELRELAFDGNRLSALPGDLLAMQPLLTHVDFASNRLARLPPDLLLATRALIRLQIRDNLLTTVSHGPLRHLGNLTELYMGDNRLRTLHPSDFADLVKLERLDISSNGLRTLPEQVLQAPADSLVHVDVSDNLLTSLVFPSELGELICLNISYNRELRHMSLIRVDDLVVSGTRLPFLPSFCVTLGHHFLVAQNMLESAEWNGPAVVAQCLGGPAALDLSDNSWLRSPQQLSTVTSAWFPINVEEVPAGWQVEARNGVLNAAKQLPQLVLAGLPLQCALVTGVARVTYGTGAVFNFVSSVSYDCSCSPSYAVGDNGDCELRRAWIDQPGHVVMLTLLTVGLLVALVFLVRRIVSRWRRMHFDLSMKERLLEDAEGDVLALKRAWQVDYADVNLQQRIDGTSPGAFGAVWKADWDGMPVAVKVMHAGILESDSSLVSDFEAEADFLMRARHNNLVRFLGTGTTAAGEPFLVLELVPRGSLTTLLRSAGEYESETLPWARRLCLGADVARGMAFIHSLGHLHRDLKAGNVLVTANFRAKVADFGSIRSLLQRRAEVSVTSCGKERGGGTGLPLDQTTTTTAPGLTSGVGTPLYMAPEVIEGASYGKGADVWSFGIVLWQLVTARSPDLLEEVGDTSRGPYLSRLLHHLSSGRRLDVGTVAAVPQWYTALQRACLAAAHTERPSFTALLSEFEAQHCDCKLTELE